MWLMKNKIIQGDCLIKLKELEDNSVDSIVTDPPYELGFMGKSWDNTGIANNKEMWAECLRVLKPGGHLLAFSGTRTYHRMAVAIEDAGFEVRDMIEWVYGSGFPKSLNIGKAVDKIQGNERKVVGKGLHSNIHSFADETKYSGTDFKPNITKGTSKWEGWGTALKPAHEPICMARKPLGQQELDIAKNICYNITEKGLITNSKIIWRIKNVKSAEKQKTNQSSTQTQQLKMVEVSAEFVETKENESVGKKIQKLIDSICESGIQEIGSKQEKQVQKAISKTKTEYQDTGKNISTNENQKLLKHTEENASVVENQDLSSLPLTTSEVVEDNIEKKSKTEISMSSLKSTDTQKTDIDCSAQTATSQWVCMDIVRILKVSFEGKEYDFIELSDGSLVWNENLEPYRKQQKLNVAENVLKYGTGGINIDESRVDVADSEKEHFEKEWDREQSLSAELGGVAMNKGLKAISLRDNVPQGRFPANLLHDNSEEVRECFPETKSSKGSFKAEDYEEHETSTNFTRGDFKGRGDSGNASRFFKSIIYQAKASKSERNAGLDVIEDKNKRPQGEAFGDGSAITEHSERKGNFHPTVKPIALMEYLIKMVTPKGGIVLDPFAGSGSTLVAAKQNGFHYIGIEMEADYIKIAEARLQAVPNKLF